MKFIHTAMHILAPIVFALALNAPSFAADYPQRVAAAARAPAQAQLRHAGAQTADG